MSNPCQKYGLVGRTPLRLPRGANISNLICVCTLPSLPPRSSRQKTEQARRAQNRRPGHSVDTHPHDLFSRTSQSTSHAVACCVRVIKQLPNSSTLGFWSKRFAEISAQRLVYTTRKSMRVLQICPTPHAAFAHQRLQTRAYIHYKSPLNAINRYMHHGSTNHYMAVPLDKNRPAEPPRAL